MKEVARITTRVVIQFLAGIALFLILTRTWERLYYFYFRDVIAPPSPSEFTELWMAIGLFVLSQCVVHVAMQFAISDLNSN